MKYNPVHPHCGPFNDVDEYQPKNKVDAVCWRHDLNYAKIIKRDGYWKAYVKYNWADEIMIRELKALGVSSGRAYRYVFEIKRLYMQYIPYVVGSAASQWYQNYKAQQYYDKPLPSNTYPRRKPTRYLPPPRDYDNTPRKLPPVPKNMPPFWPSRLPPKKKPRYGAPLRRGYSSIYGYGLRRKKKYRFGGQGGWYRNKRRKRMSKWWKKK
jgi:hypothetical protein